ncbi:MAG: GNAT family N-acetyltransferase [Pseudonocardia sediminis]
MASPLVPGDHRIRTATPADYDPIVTVMDGWWGRTVSPVLPRLFLQHFHETSFVAEDASGLTGFLVAFVSPASSQDAYIHFAGVRPERRGQGLARALYATFLDLARARGCTRVRAITPPRNQDSVRFHRALGFDVSEPQADYHGPGQDRIVFTRRI